jgi:hypothetical protein
MTANSSFVQNNRFKVGWLIALILSAVMTLNHLVLMFVVKELGLFIGWAAFNLYATLVLWFPFRRGEKWAWFSSWILVIGLASAIFFDPQIGAWYLGVAVVIAVSLLLTWPVFFQANKQ